MGVLLTLIGMSAERSTWEYDLSTYGVNRPAPATQTLLEKLDRPVVITAFMAEHRVQRKQISDLVARLP